MAFRRSSPTGAALIAGLCLPGLLYASITLFWQSRGTYPVAGDEPHYLILADSLMSGRLDLREAYAAAPGSGLKPKLQTVERGPHLYSHHGLGLPVLVAIPLRLGGVTAVKLALSLLAGCLVTAFYFAFLLITGSPRWSIAAYLVTALGLPYAMAAGQIYPDLIVGLINLYLFYSILRGWPREGPAYSRFTFAAACGLLPWLHHRHLPVAVLFTIAFVARLVLAERPSPMGGAASPDRRRIRWPRLLAPLAVALTLQLLELAYTLWLFGSLTGAKAPQPDLLRSTMLLLGLHLDQFHGLFFQNPLLLLGLAGLAIFARKTPAAFALWAAVYTVSVLPVTAVGDSGYGGPTFPGRYDWDFAPLWIFPLAHLAAWVLRQERGKAAMALLFAGAAGVQVALAWSWVRGEIPLIVAWGRPVWAMATFYPGLRWHLPWFGQQTRFVGFWPNFSWAILALSLVALGVWLAGRRPRRLWSFLLLLAATSLIFIPETPRLKALEFPGSALYRETGHDEGPRRSARAVRDGPGALTYGPYLDLPPGCYEVLLRYEATYPDGTRPSRWDWAAARGATALASGELAAAPEGALLRRQLLVPAGGYLSTFEVRVWYSGSGDVTVEKLSISPSTDCNGTATAPR